MQDKSVGWVIALFVVVVGVFAGLYLAYMEFDKWWLRRTYGEDIAGICMRPVSGSASAINAPTSAKPWQALVLDGEHKSKWHGDLPKEARADSRDEVDVVVCVTDKRKSKVGECPRVSVDGSSYFVLDRMQFYQDLYVFNPDTGQLITMLQVWGAPPGPCPDLRVGSKSEDIEGQDPVFRDFYYTLMSVTWR